MATPGRSNLPVNKVIPRVRQGRRVGRIWSENSVTEYQMSVQGSAGLCSFPLLTIHLVPSKDVK